MQSKEVIKKLADTYETLLFVSERHPSSMSRLKNLLMSEGISETSARRKIADLDTEDGCLVVDGIGRLQLNQELISKMSYGHYDKSYSKGNERNTEHG